MPTHVLQDGEVQLYTNHPKFPAPDPARVQDCLLDIAANGDTAVQAFKLDLVRDIDNDAGKLMLEIRFKSHRNGRFDPASRALSIAVNFQFRFSLEALPGVVVAKATLKLDTTTGTVQMPDGSPLQGQPVGADGTVVLVGQGTMQSDEAQLQGVRCSFRLTGRLDPSPA